MAWSYSQFSGDLVYDGRRIAFGYSGNGAAKNNPLAQSEANHGPIPQGLYTMQEPIDSPTHGPYAIPLVPFPSNLMFERFGFLVHGDSLVSPGQASDGCIILPRSVREQMWNSGDHTLSVVSGFMPADLDGEIAT
jgi:hypothetical protein